MVSYEKEPLYGCAEKRGGAPAPCAPPRSEKSTTGDSRGRQPFLQDASGCSYNDKTLKTI